MFQIPKCPYPTSHSFWGDNNQQQPTTTTTTTTTTTAGAAGAAAAAATTVPTSIPTAFQRNPYISSAPTGLLARWWASAPEIRRRRAIQSIACYIWRRAPCRRPALLASPGLMWELFKIPLIFPRPFAGPSRSFLKLSRVGLCHCRRKLIFVGAIHDQETAQASLLTLCWLVVCGFCV